MKIKIRKGIYGHGSKIKKVRIKPKGVIPARIRERRRRGWGHGKIF